MGVSWQEVMGLAVPKAVRAGLQYSRFSPLRLRLFKRLCIDMALNYLGSLHPDTSATRHPTLYFYHRLHPAPRKPAKPTKALDERMHDHRVAPEEASKILAELEVGQIAILVLLFLAAGLVPV